MIDRYVADATDLDPGGDYVLYTDHAELCEAVRKWAETKRLFRDDPTPDNLQTHYEAENKLIALANQPPAGLPA